MRAKYSVNNLHRRSFHSTPLYSAHRYDGVIVLTNTRVMVLGLVCLYFLPLALGAPPATLGNVTTIAPTTVGTTKGTFTGNPTGHCEPDCRCEMSGQYYSVGERWVLPGDTCTTYQCFSDSTSKPVTSGCLFKGECKADGSTWSEGCNNYTCIREGSTNQYQLVAVGCHGNGGWCVAVGETIQDGCGILQCQINSGRLALTTITTGCSVEGGCKPSNSFWHDGCRVYTCAMELQTAVKRRVDNATMHWPEGHYALMKPHTGCPTDSPNRWTDDVRTLYTYGNNSVSDPHSMAGNITTVFSTHRVCVHSPDTNHDAAAGYQTYWESGRYCILRSSGVCPRGFKEGYVLLNVNNNNASIMANASGVHPDGNVGINTGMVFCCRDDGDVRDEIVLPKDSHFVLFMLGDEKQICQNVRGMVHSMEHFTNVGAVDVQNGTLPAYLRNSGNITIYTCLYKPIDCGCTDGVGGSVPLNAERTVDCITTRCIAELGTNRMEFVKGGCSVDGRCEAEDSQWSVTAGDHCTPQTCRRIVGNVIPQFNITDGRVGCLDESVCREVAYEKRQGCQTSRCVLDTNTGTSMFKVVETECPWLDSCKPANATWRHSCITYRCDVVADGHQYRWSVKPVEYACEWNGACYKEGAVWSEGCIDYTCVITRHKDQMEWGIETARLACLDFNQKCRDVGENFTENCVTYQCKHTGDKIGLQAISTGCEWKTECKPENSTWTDQSKCANYECVKERRTSGSVMRIRLVDYGCVFNNTCKAVNDKWKDGCRTRKCTVQQTDQTISRSTAAVSAECDDEGVCRPLGYKKMTDICMEYTCAWSDEHKDAFFTLFGGACRYEGKCHLENSTWVEKTPGMCATFQCEKTNEGYLSSVIEQSCRSTDGKCQPVGATGFQADIQGQLRNDCTCVNSPNKQAGISLKCTGA